jgi:hypothetical protein
MKREAYHSPPSSVIKVNNFAVIPVLLRRLAPCLIKHKGNFFFAYYRPPLWSSCQSSWLQIQRSGFDYRRYYIFWEVVSLERGPLRFVSTIEELLGRKSSGRRGSTALTTRHHSPQKLAQTSLISGNRSVGIVLSRTQATEFFITFVAYDFMELFIRRDRHICRFRSKLCRATGIIS